MPATLPSASTRSAMLLIAACLLILVVRPGRAAEWSNTNNTTWDQRTTTGCVANNGGNGEMMFELAIDRSNPAVLAVTFIASGGGSHFFPVAGYTLTVTFADGTALQLPGRGGTTVGDLNAFTGFVGAADVATWVHELTATNSMTISGGQLPRPFRTSLAGSSHAVDGLEKCIRAARIGGVSLPFRADPSAQATATTAPCLEYGQRVTLTGTLVERPNHAPNYELKTFTALQLTSPICATRFGVDPAEGDQRYVEIDANPSSSPKTGRKLTLSGILRHQFSMVENGPLILGISGNPF